MTSIREAQKKFRLRVQIIFTILSNGYLIGFAEGKIYRGTSKTVCVPGLNCYSCPGAIASCPIGSLQAVLGSKDYKMSFYLVGFLMVVGSIFGRFVCGWLCPFGLVQDLIHRIPSKKIRRIPMDKQLRYVKFGILGIFVIAMPILLRGESGYGSPWFCKLICPSGTLMAGIPLVSMNPVLQKTIGFLFGWKMAILLIFLLGSVYIYRPFCKYICPLGAIYGFFNKFSLYNYEVDSNLCNGCGICANKCRMDVKIYENPRSMECIRCGECIKNCPQNAIGVINKTLNPYK